jgi:hypothetical protein
MYDTIDGLNVGFLYSGALSFPFDIEIAEIVFGQLFFMY